MTRSTLLVTSWPVKSGLGSGVARVAAGLPRALAENGVKAQLIHPSFSGGGYFSTTAKRLLFNLSLLRAPEIRSGTPIVAFDFDGFLFSGTTRFAQINGGVLADIVRFESGAVKQAVRFMARLEQSASRKAERIFTPSVYAKNVVCRHYRVPPEKVSVMHNGLFFDEWTHLVNKAPKENGRPPTVLAVARFYRRKGLDLLIRAWPAVLARVTDAQLIIVGDGLERENLKRLAVELGVGRSVRWTGPLFEEEKTAARYANCDLFCLPSRHETFGLVFIEAMAAGLPVVALNSTAVPEVVRDGVDGFLVQPDDAGSIAGKIVELLDNRELREMMGNNGRERVKMEFDFKKTVRPLVDWLGEKNV